ncbi:MAG: hypothetical protein OEZ08_19150, partial [Betaproteobacteria bacterium]|nr:hypothetical protein [Betaproteobacteria bacterium]
MNPELPKETHRIVDKLLKLAIVLGLGMLLYLVIYGRVFQPLLDAALANQWTRVIARPSTIWISMGALLLAFRTVLLFRYRQATAANLSNAPMLTVIVPAY